MKEYKAIFDAMERRETYATTGPRMLVRLFGGFDFVEADANTRSPALVGYTKGVPMGGDIGPAPAGKARPVTATPIEQIKIKKDFRIELLYTVPAATQGSWVNLCVDRSRLRSRATGLLLRARPRNPHTALDGI